MSHLILLILSILLSDIINQYYSPFKVRVTQTILKQQISVVNNRYNPAF